MTLEKSIERISWQFSRGVSFKPNDADVISWNNIIQWIASQKQVTMSNQQLFAKLYIEKLVREIRESKSTVFDNDIQKEVSRVLSMPIELFYKAFHSDLHNNQIRKVLKDKLKEDVTFEDMENKYTLDFVTNKLNEMITESINEFE